LGGSFEREAQGKKSGQPDRCTFGTKKIKFQHRSKAIQDFANHLKKQRMGQDFVEEVGRTWGAGNLRNLETRVPRTAPEGSV
jgi:hypothetical protein